MVSGLAKVEQVVLVGQKVSDLWWGWGKKAKSNVTDTMKTFLFGLKNRTFVWGKMEA